MAGQMIIAGLDLGTHSIKCVIGVHHDDGKIDIIGRGAHPSNGFKNRWSQTRLTPCKV